MDIPTGSSNYNTSGYYNAPLHTESTGWYQGADFDFYQESSSVQGIDHNPNEVLQVPVLYSNAQPGHIYSRDPKITMSSGVVNFGAYDSQYRELSISPRPAC